MSKLLKDFKSKHIDVVVLDLKEIIDIDELVDIIVKKMYDLHSYQILTKTDRLFLEKQIITSLAVNTIEKATDTAVDTVTINKHILYGEDIRFLLGNKAYNQIFDKYGDIFKTPFYYSVIIDVIKLYDNTISINIYK